MINLRRSGPNASLGATQFVTQHGRDYVMKHFFARREGRSPVAARPVTCRPSRLSSLAWLVAALLLVAAAPAAYAAPKAPSAITVGCLYAKTGFLSYQSMQMHRGLAFWKDEVNSHGGVYVKTYGKRLPIKFTCYNDQSDPSLVTVMMNRLIDDKVDVLVADASSFLTAPAVPIAEAHRVLLVNPLGTSKKFYTPNNPYIVQTSDLVTRFWADSITKLLMHMKLKRVAIIYGTNDFDGPQAEEVDAILTRHGVKPVYYHAVPTKTSNYTVILHRIAATRPQAVLEIGYDPNDVTFLKNMKAGGFHFPFVYILFPDLAPAEFTGMGNDLKYIYCYVTAPTLRISSVNIGLTTDQFVTRYQKKAGAKPDAFVTAGYVAGLVVQRALATANNMTQLGLRQAMARMSGKTRTLGGTFTITKEGAQMGIVSGVAQFLPTSSGFKLKVVYPAKFATAKAVYPAPKS